MKTPARLILAALGVAFVTLAVSGRAVLFVRPWFVAGLVVTGLVVLLVAWRERPSVSPSTALLLMLPVAAGLTLTPSLVGRIPQGPATTSSLAARIGDAPNPLVAGRGGDVTLLQIMLAEQQLGGVYLAGRSVTVVATVAGPRTLSRSAIVCCAADARRIALSEVGASLPRVGVWVRVSGRLALRGQKVILDAATVARIPSPADPFL